MGKLGFSLLSLLILLSSCSATYKETGEVQYDIRFPNAEHNEAEITLTLTDMDAVPVQISMSRTSPGRYALHEFSKNIYDVIARNGEGDTLEVYRPDLHNWIITGHNGTVTFEYTLYADHADGTYPGVNEQHAHLNIPASLAWARGLESAPVVVRFHPPEESNWKVATQLQPTDDPNTFVAPDFYYLMDSPTELSDFSMREWQLETDSTNYTIRLALHHQGTEEQLDRYASMAQKVVREQVAIFGEPPVYDYGTYTFIADYLPYVYGDGMEHRNSTILTSRRSLEEGALRNLNTLSHEYFHGWNVERIRPMSLEPFNFLEPNVSGALWFAEGFTSYYDDLTIRRAGLIDDKAYAEGLSGMLNYVLNSPGNRFYSPVEMSMQAPFVDAATSVDAQNKSNTFISYYSWGAVIGLGLDLTLRTEFDSVTLDDFMRAMWQKFGKPETPYNLEDLQRVLAEVTDTREFAEEFFENYVYAGNMIKLEPLFAKAGFHLRRESPGRAVMQFGEAKIDFSGARPTISQNTIIGSPLYEAGIDRGDILLELDGQPVRNAREVNRIVAAHEPGDELMVTYESLGVPYTSTLTLAEDRTLELVPYEEAGMEVTDAIQSFRDNWLGSKVDFEGDAQR